MESFSTKKNVFVVGTAYWKCLKYKNKYGRYFGKISTRKDEIARSGEEKHRKLEKFEATEREVEILAISQVGSKLR